jgi:serine O-acetyltransferase
MEGDRMFVRPPQADGMWQTLKQDLKQDGCTSWKSAIGRALFTQRVQSVALLRLSQALHRQSPLFGSLVKYVNGVLTGCDIAAGAKIGPGLRLYHPNGVVVGPEVVIGKNCRLMQAVTLGSGTSFPGSPTLDDGVTVGPGAVVLGNVLLGERSFIGANAVVTKDIPAHEMWAGNPARYVRGY